MMQDNTIVLLAGEGILATVGTVALVIGQTGIAETLFGALVGLIAGHLNGRQSQP
jgi:hypothetical protein